MPSDPGPEFDTFTRALQQIFPQFDLVQFDLQLGSKSPFRSSTGGTLAHMDVADKL